MDEKFHSLSKGDGLEFFMRLFVGLWIAPLAFYWSWISLAKFDAWPSSIVFSRQFYDALFANYQSILGLSEDQIFRMMINLTLIDLAIIGAILAYRKRKQIRAWFARGAIVEASNEGFSLPPAASIGLAPLAK